MKYIIYARKSSESEDRQAKSIEDQISTMREIARRDGIEIVQIFQESKSAKDPGRPIFNEMIKKFEQGKFDAILCWKIDRLARNPKDEGTIKWMLQKGIIKIIKTNDRDYLPDDNALIASVEFGMANQYVRDLSKNVRRGLDEKVKRGEYATCPPLGYKTNYKTRKMEVDEIEAQYVVKAFKLYVTGNYSLKSLADLLFDEGLRSHTGKKVYHGSIYTMLKNPVYYGYFIWKGILQKGVHEPLISKDLFDEAQDIMEPKKHCKQDKKKHFLFRGFMHCACGLRMTAEIRKKVHGDNVHWYTYYHCTKSKGFDQCDQRKYVSEKDLILEIGQSVDDFSFDYEILEVAVQAIKENGTRQGEYEQDIENKNTFLLERNRSRQKALVEKYIDDKIPENLYQQTLKELREEEATLDCKTENMERSSVKVFEAIQAMLMFLKLAGRIFKDGDDETKKEVLSILSSNLIIKNKKVFDFALKEPFSCLLEDLKNFNLPKGGNSTFVPNFEPVYALSKTKTEAHTSACIDMWAYADSNCRPLQCQCSALTN